MVMTILEAHVAAEKWSTLEKVYSEETKQLGPGIAQTFLLHGSNDSTLWRIATVWRSREALAEMRASGDTPVGVLIFRAADAEPQSVNIRHCLQCHRLLAAYPRPAPDR